MTVVVDLGCADWGTQDSLGALIYEYEPDRAYGFDPHPQIDTMRHRWLHQNGCRVRLVRKAAWLYNGHVGFHENITRSVIDVDGADVPCFDFSRWLSRRGESCVVKMDVEGAEYALLERMITDGTDELVDELVIEWHGDPARNSQLVELLDCPVRDWWM